MFSLVGVSKRGTKGEPAMWKSIANAGKIEWFKCHDKWLKDNSAARVDAKCQEIHKFAADKRRVCGLNKQKSENFAINLMNLKYIRFN